MAAMQLLASGTDKVEFSDSTFACPSGRMCQTNLALTLDGNRIYINDAGNQAIRYLTYKPHRSFRLPTVPKSSSIDTEESDMRLAPAFMFVALLSTACSSADLSNPSAMSIEEGCRSMVSMQTAAQQVSPEIGSPEYLEAYAIYRDWLEENAPLQPEPNATMYENLAISLIEPGVVPQAEYDEKYGEAYDIGWGLYNETCASNRDFRLVDDGLVGDAADYIDSQMTGS